MTGADPLRDRAAALRLHGLLDHWQEARTAGWVEALIDWGEQERQRRSLERRLKGARIGRFKPHCDFDWTWPARCDHAVVEALMTLDFLVDATNAVIVGPNGIGKSIIARNIAHQAVLRGHTVLFTNAGQILGVRAALDSDSALRRRIRHYAAPAPPVIDEVGYLSYSNRDADLLFELVIRRCETKSTLVTTNRPFAEWHQVFPSAACVVSLVGRLVHNAEILPIDGDSWRLKEATERAERRARRNPASRSRCRSASMHTGRPTRRSPSANSSTTCASKSGRSMASRSSSSASLPNPQASPKNPQTILISPDARLTATAHILCPFAEYVRFYAAANIMRTCP